MDEEFCLFVFFVSFCDGEIFESRKKTPVMQIIMSTDACVHQNNIGNIGVGMFIDETLSYCALVAVD